MLDKGRRGDNLRTKIKEQKKSSSDQFNHYNVGRVDYLTELIGPERETCRNELSMHTPTLKCRQTAK